MTFSHARALTTTSNMAANHKSQWHFDETDSFINFITDMFNEYGKNKLMGRKNNLVQIGKRQFMRYCDVKMLCELRYG